MEKIFESFTEFYERINEKYVPIENLEYKEILDKSFNISGKYPSAGVDFVKGIKKMITDEEYVNQRLKKGVVTSAEQLYTALLSGDIKKLQEIRSKYENAMLLSKKLYTKTFQHRTAEVEIYNVANAAILKLGYN